MKYQELAASLRQALLNVGWTLRHDYVGVFVVRRGEYNLKVGVYEWGTEVYLSRKTAKGGYAKVLRSKASGDDRPEFVFGSCHAFGVLEPLPKPDSAQ